MADPSCEFERPVLGPAATKWFAQLFATVRQLLLLDGEDGAVLHLDISHRARPAAPVGESHVVATGLGAGNSQALVVVDRAIAVIPALVRTPVVFPRRRHLECRNRIRREIPEPDGLAVL